MKISQHSTQLCIFRRQRLAIKYEFWEFLFSHCFGFIIIQLYECVDDGRIRFNIFLFCQVFIEFCSYCLLTHNLYRSITEFHIKISKFILINVLLKIHWNDIKIFITYLLCVCSKYLLSQALSRKKKQQHKAVLYLMCLSSKSLQAIFIVVQECDW